MKADLALLEEIGPDLVIGDFRLSLGISCRVLGIPYVSLVNAHSYSGLSLGDSWPRLR